MGLVVDILSADEIGDREIPWDALVRRSSAASVFQTWAWHRAALTVLPVGAQARIVTVRSDGELCAIAPMVRWPGWPRRLRLLNAHTAADHLDVILPADADERIVRALRDGVLQAAEDVDAIEFEACRADAQAGLLMQRLVGFRECMLMRTDVCPYVDLGTGFDDYLKRRFDKKRRYNITRDMKRAAEHFGLRHEIVSERGALAAGMRELFELHGERRRSRGLDSAFLTEPSRRFHGALSDLLHERGWLSLQFLRRDAQPVSALYGFEYGRRFYYFQSGIGAQGESMGAGSVLIASAMQRASQQGPATEFDFLRGDEPYKAKWATGSRLNYTWRAYRTGVAGAVHVSYHRVVAGIKSLRRRPVPASQAPATSEGAER